MRRPRPWVIVPGIWNSDPDHWQSRWEAERAALDGRVLRIAPSSWSEPDVTDWCDAVTRAVTASDEAPVLIAHSLGVLAVAAWLRDAAHPAVAGAFLVAPPDPGAPGFPDAAVGFPDPAAAPGSAAAPESAATQGAAAAPGSAAAAWPTGAGVPSRLVVSDDDPYCSSARAVASAEAIGAEVVRVGALGHVNVASGIGGWAAGRALLTDFERSL